MEEPLFNFLLLRPAVRQDPRLPNIELTQQSDFQKKLAIAAASPNPRDSIIAASKELIADKSRFIADPSGTAFSAKVVVFGRAVDSITKDSSINKDGIAKAVQDNFAASPAQVIATDDYKNLLSNLRDSVLAIKYVQEQHQAPIDILTNEIRDLELIAEIANPTLDQAAPDLSSRLHLFRKRPVLLPSSADLKSILSNAAADAAAARDFQTKFNNITKNAGDLIVQHGQLTKAIQELSTVDVNQFQATALTDHPGFPLEDDLTGRALIASQLRFTSELQKLNLSQLGDKPQMPVTASPPATETITGPILVHPPIVINPAPGTSPAPVTRLAQENTQPESLQLPILSTTATAPSISLAGSLLGSKGGVSTKGSLTAEALTLNGLRLRPEALAGFHPETKALLDQNSIRTDLTPLDTVLKTLHGQLSEVTTSLLNLSPPADQISIRNVGDSIVAIHTPIVSDISRLVLAGDIESIGNIVNRTPPDGRIPHTRGKVKPAGIADLLIVKQTLKGYELADIAHVENVLKGEAETADQTTTHRTEATDSTEQEASTEDDKEQDSTSRFEMSKESAAAIKEDESLKAGLKVSAKYGPFVELSASVEGSLSRSKEESVKSASKFSQEVTDKAVKKITERTLTKTTTVQFDETITKEGHSIDNSKAPTGNIAGVYQFLNKVYEAQVFNYGLRTMFDFMVPEPGAWTVSSLTKKATQATQTTLVKPLPFTIRPSQLNDHTYQSWVARYQATDVNPPPDYFVTKVDQVNKGGGDNNVNYVHSATIGIPAGYEAVYASVTQIGTNWDPKHWCTDVSVGRAVHRFAETISSQWGTNLANEIGEIAWGASTVQVANFVVGVEVMARRTDKAYQDWQMDTHAKLVNAYKAREQEYEEKLASLKITSGITIQGTNPTANLQTIKTELKKNVISILTDQHFDLFNSVTDLGYGPEINIFEAAGEGAYVRFFEQAFEWDQLSYVVYPYFWSVKSGWQNKQLYDDPDPVFNEFLQAGFARVVVPGRPGFEGAIDHFMTFGELWDGGPLPPIGSNLYLPIASEIEERLSMPSGEIPQGEPWTVKVPTQLVKLRLDDKLPTWTKAADGTFVAVGE